MSLNQLSILAATCQSPGNGDGVTVRLEPTYDCTLCTNHWAEARPWTFQVRPHTPDSGGDTQSPSPPCVSEWAQRIFLEGEELRGALPTPRAMVLLGQMSRRPKDCNPRWVEGPGSQVCRTSGRAREGRESEGQGQSLARQ